MKPRFQLLLLQRAVNGFSPNPRRASERGFFMAVVVLLLLGVVLGSVAIANRLGSGALRASLQGQSREARAVADSGVLAVVNELNKFENRELLVTRTANGWSSANTNPCASATGVPTALMNAEPTATALGYRNGMGTEIQLPGDPTRRFVVRRIEVLLPDRSNYSWALRSPGSGGITTDSSPQPNVYNGRDSVNLTDANSVGYLRLTVEGRYLRDGSQVSSATVTREFQVVPKCCFGSFGPVYPNGPGGAQVSNVHGVDDRDCNLVGQDALGLVAFGTGSVASSVGGVDIKVDSPAGNDLAAVLCVSGSCTVPASFGNAQVVNSRLNLPLVPTAPSGSGSYPAISSTATLPNTSFCILVSGLTRFVQNPAELNPGTETAWRCRVSSINLTGNETLTIYTNATAANTSGPTAASGASVPVRIWLTGDISLLDTSDIRHVKGSSTLTVIPNNVIAFVDANVATNPADGILNFYDLQIYGNALGGSAQTIDLRGNVSGLSLFLFAPTAAVSFSSGGGASCNVSGQFWASSFAANSSVTVCTPQSIYSGGFDMGIKPVVYDAVARSASGARLYGVD